MVQVGDKIRIVSDNEDYAKYLGIDWIVEHVSYSIEDHPGYDTSVGGPLVDCVDLPFSLYAYEYMEV